MDPIVLTIGGALTSAVLYLFRKMERSEERCREENKALNVRMDQSDKERREILAPMVAITQRIDRRMERDSERTPMPSEAHG